MTESTTVEDGLNCALRTLLADLTTDEPTALATFREWCLEHSEDIQLRGLVEDLSR